MRRAALVVVVCLALASCATPEIRLQARFVPGEVREYRLVADADVQIVAQQRSTTDHTRLDATTRITVTDVAGGVTTLELRIVPRRLTRSGGSAGLPPEQVVQMKVGADGRVVEVTSAGATPVQLEAADIQDLVPLIGPPLPSGRVHLTDRWSATPAPTTTPAGIEQARLAALRVVQGRDCAIVAISTRRPVVRERTVSGTTLRLEGTEFASSEIAFDFRDGLPVTIRSDGEARLGISGAATNGTVVIHTLTTLTLIRRTLPPTVP